MCSTSEDVQCESGTSSVQARMCSTSQARHQYKRGYAVQIRELSIRERMYSTNHEDHQILVWGGGGDTTQRYFSINGSLVLLIYQVNTASNPWLLAKIS